MNSLNYFGYSVLAYLAEQIAKDNGYAVIDVDGLPLCGLVKENKKTVLLQVKEEVARWK